MLMYSHIVAAHLHFANFGICDTFLFNVSGLCYSVVQRIQRVDN